MCYEAGNEAGTAKGFLSLRYRVQIVTGVHPPSYPMGTGGFYRVGKATEA